MRVPMYLAASLIALLGCDTQRLTDGLGSPVDTIPARSYYVAPTGRIAGDGSLAQPWDLPTALSHPASVRPGDTIWLRGGTYRGEFSSKLTGRQGAPLIVRQHPGERATIDGRLLITGSFTYYWDFEVMYSDLDRVTTLPGTDPADLPRENMMIEVHGPYNKLINLVLHDLGHGVFAGSPTQGMELYGNLIYNNGWIGGDRSHGHNLYLQNRWATKYVLDNVLFNSFSTGLKIGGSGEAYLWNFHVEGNTSFASGSPAGSGFNMHHQGGGGNLGFSRYIKNSFYHANGVDKAFEFNQAGDPPGEDLLFTENIVQGRVQFHEWKKYAITRNKFTSGSALLSGENTLVAFRVAPNVPLSSHTWDANTYAAPAASPKKPFYKFQDGSDGLFDFGEWKAATRYDPKSSYLAGEFSGADVIVRPNRYEAGRAFITCWNWQSAASLSVNVSAVLRTGDGYQIHHVYDIFGPPLLSGTYDGELITIPQTAITPPRPIGYASAPSSTGPKFNVYLLRRI